MKMHIWYSTSAIALITTRLGNVYQVDLPCHELDWFRFWAQEALEEDSLEIPSRMISKINFIDFNTGELLLGCECGESGPTEVREDEEDYGDWDYNEDMGYDPYLGCYTDDC